MAELVVMGEQHSKIQPPTVAIQATTWWEVVYTRTCQATRDWSDSARDWSDSAPTCQGMLLLNTMY